MSVLLAVAQVAPAAHPVVETITKYVNVYHTQIVSAASTLLGAGLGTGAFFLHGLLLEDRLSQQLNRVLALIYVAGLVVLDLFVTGQLTSGLTPEAAFQTYLTILGANQGVHMLVNLYSPSSTPAQAPAASQAF